MQCGLTCELLEGRTFADAYLAVDQLSREQKETLLMYIQLGLSASEKSTASFAASTDLGFIRIPAACVLCILGQNRRINFVPQRSHVL